MLVPDRDFDRPERRPKKWETFRGAETGIDPKAMKAEIAALRQRCRQRRELPRGARGIRRLCARARRPARLRHHRPGRRRSQPGAASRSARGRTARIHGRSRSGHRASVEQAKALQRERQAQAQIWDRDAANRDWESQVAERRDADSRPSRRAMERRGQNRSEKSPRRTRCLCRTRARAASARTGQGRATKFHRAATADDIRAAFAATCEMDAGEALQGALAERGIGLAAVSPEEAYASERQAAFAREVGHVAAAEHPGKAKSSPSTARAMPIVSMSA